MQSETASRANWYRRRAADYLALTEHAPTNPVKAHRFLLHQILRSRGVAGGRGSALASIDEAVE
jgi:hypothetical protein